jgi:hypothetical protein
LDLSSFAEGDVAEHFDLSGPGIEGSRMRRLKHPRRSNTIQTLITALRRKIRKMKKNNAYPMAKKSEKYVAP